MDFIILILWETKSKCDKMDGSDIRLEKLTKVAKKNIKDILKELNTSKDGLTGKEASKRLEKYGPNELPREKPDPWYKQLLDAFIHPFIMVLIILGLASFVTDILFAPPGEENWRTIIIVAIMITVSVLLRFTLEYTSNIEAEKLRSLIYTTATVIRDGRKKEIKMEKLVPGDIIYLSAGDMIPADVRIIESKDLFINEATITGESEPVEKCPKLSEEKIRKKHLSIGELDNICFMGTNVISGYATAVVVSTGKNTYFGSITKSIVGKKVTTTFERDVVDVTKLLIKFMTVMVPLVFIINFFTKHDWLDSLLFALAVGVGITPEMLPMVVTANLAKSAIKMAKRKTIVKKLDSIQNFGNMDVLCTDKTGTLTLNKIFVEKHVDISGEENENVLKYAYLNSYYQTGLKSALDDAILKYGRERKFNGLESKFKKLDEIPFDFTRRRISVLLKDKEGDGGNLLVTKGAVEELLSICKWVEYNNRIVKLTKEMVRKALEIVEDLNEDGMRVLAVAKKNKLNKKTITSEDEQDMILLGFIAFLDPPKESALPAIKALKKHGVDVKILTGDNEIVTKKICKEVNLPIKGILLGEEIEDMSFDELVEVVEDITIFAKVSPQQKLKIIKALKKRGHVVGYLGDGVNDVPSLRESDVGISVDTGVDAAKEVSDIVLLEKNLMVLERAIIEGRKSFANSSKYIVITASSNFGNVFSVLVASSFLPFIPMLPLQLLLLNLIYDLSMTSMPWDNVDEKYIKKPRRWSVPKISNFMVWFGPISSIFDIITYVVMFFIICPFVVGNSYFHLPRTLMHEFISTFQTGWFVESLWTQTLVVHTLRTEKVPFLQSMPGRPLLFLSLTGITIGTLIPFTIIGRMFSMNPLPWLYFPFLLIVVFSYLFLAQKIKKIFIEKFGSLL